MGRYDEQQRSNPLFIILLWGLLLAGLIAAGYYLLKQQNPAQHPATIQTTALPIPEEIAKQKSEAITPAPEITAPQQPQDQEGEIKPQLAFELSSAVGDDAQVRKFFLLYSAELLPMLQTDNLLKKLARILNDFAQGQRQYKHMREFTLPSPFMAEKSGHQWMMNQQAYARYNTLINGLIIMDDSMWLHAYNFFKPHLQKTYTAFGYPAHYTLEDMLQKAAAEIIATPELQGDHALIKHGVLYKFADPELEKLSPVQKQVLRMGPENSRKLKQKLRQVMQLLVAQVKE